jgi:uncharacterized repeat protein (TIGR03803 family)
MVKSRFAALCALALAALATAAHAPAAQAQTYTESTIYSFSSTVGTHPFNGFIQGSDADFYGVAYRSGANSNDQVGGTAFKITAAGDLTVLHSFPASATDGALPEAIMIQGTDGNFYGTTTVGGANDETNLGDGTIFKITPSGTVTILHSFNGSSTTDGAYPQAGLIQGTDGNFYGTVSDGGKYGYGAVYKITPGGTFSLLYSFTGTGTDGAQPFSGLVQGSDGDFYGCTYEGGGGYGTIYKVTASGTFTLVYSPTSAQGAACSASLVEGSDGDFYGAAYAGGPNSLGTFYKVNSSGSSFTVLHTFGSGTDGGQPFAGPVLATDGNFYQTTSTGGANNEGVIDRISPTGTTKTVYTFLGGSTDGGQPDGAMTQANDGNFYSTTAEAGASGAGTVFELAVSPALAPPVQLTIPASVAAGASFTLTYKVFNAYSDTLGYCFATNTASASDWTGLITGKTTSQSKTLTASKTAGKYTYALTCGGTETGTATVTVGGSSKDNSTTTLTASPNPATVGQKVTLKATVTGSGSTPTGTIDYSVDSITFGSASLSSGVASFAATSNGIAPGVYPVVATYAGSSSYNGSASKALNVTLNKAPTSTTLTASPTSVTPPADVTLTATVKRSTSGATGDPTGSVTFSVGSVTIATVKLSAGVATLKASSAGQAAGSYPITAKYSGDPSDNSSTSSAVSVTVK